jgi:DNA-binding GntR family transcriptional regulator
MTTTSAAQVFAQLMREILSGTLRPREQLSEREVVQRFGVSRTPAREALARLHAKGFLSRGARGAAVVRDIGRAELAELYALRLHLEAWAAPLTVAHITPTEIARLQEINRRFEKAVDERDLPAMLDVKAEFHSTTAAATRNRWLAEVLVSLREKAYVVRYASWQDVRHAQDTVEIHEQMIEALRRRDLKRYRRLVDEHVRGPRDLYMSRLVAPPPAAAANTAVIARRRRASARPRRGPRLTRRAKENDSR